MADRLRLGFWGTGVWATMCAGKIAKIPSIDIVKCYSKDSDDAIAAFCKAADCQSVDSEDELLRDLDAVAIFTPNHLHCEHVLKTIDKKLHVYIEKPMANTAKEARKIVETAKSCKNVLFCGHNGRREQRYRKVKELLQQGKTGQTISVDVVYTSSMGLSQGFGYWRYDPKTCPITSLFQIGVHAIDNLHYLFGPVTKTQAWANQLAMQQGMDVCLARMEFAEGFSAVLNNAYTVPRARSIRIMGTGGMLLSEKEDEIIYFDQAEGTTQVIAVETNDTVTEEFCEFAHCCLTGEQPETDGLVGYRAVAVVDAMVKSAQDHCEVQIVEDV